MFSKIRRRLTYTNIALTLALVFAMTGGAYAANRYVITSTKQISPKVLKALKGASGKSGPAGPVGAAGSQGPAAAAGAKGETGPAGAKGEPGTPGEKGKEGKEGKEGSPWTVGGHLPADESETGQWAVSQSISGSFGIIQFGIAFPIPLEKALDVEHVHYLNAEEGAGEAKENLPEGCSGNYKAPKAARGYLCAFTTNADDLPNGPVDLSLSPENAETGLEGAGKSGAYLSTTLFVKGEIVASGDWVVTAP